MKILITGASGFIGTNLSERIQREFSDTVLLRTCSKTPDSQISKYAHECDAVFYLAAIHRSQDPCDFQRCNCDLLAKFLSHLENAGNLCPIIFTSSRQAGENSAYGLSKSTAEKMVWDHAEKYGTSCVVYRLTNTFGRYARPCGHSVVATFCHHLQRDIPIVVNDTEKVMHFYYIDDVVSSLLEKMKESLYSDVHVRDRRVYRLPENMIYSVTLGVLAAKLHAFAVARKNHKEPSARTLFDRRLLYTYDGYAPTNKE